MKFTIMALKKINKRMVLKIALFSFSVAPVFFAFFIFTYSQNTFRLYYEPVVDEHRGEPWDYSQKLMIQTLDGFHIHRYEFARFLADETNLASFYPTGNFTLERVSRNLQKPEVLLAIWGENLGGNPVLSLIRYTKYGFHRIPIFDEDGHEKESFCRAKVLLKNVDSDPDIEVIETYKKDYTNHTTETFRTYYDYDSIKDEYRWLKNTTEITLNPFDWEGYLHGPTDPMIIKATKLVRPEKEVKTPSSERKEDSRNLDIF